MKDEYLDNIFEKRARQLSDSEIYKTLNKANDYNPKLINFVELEFLSRDLDIKKTLLSQVLKSFLDYKIDIALGYYNTKSNNKNTSPIIKSNQMNINSQIKEWFYEYKGNRIGPISEKEILDLINIEKITNDSLVWKKGFVDWRIISETELSKFFIKNSNEPPPLAGHKINNTFIWILAFAPIIGINLQGFIAGMQGKTLEDFELKNAINNLWWVTLILNVFLCWLDERRLKSAGHKTEKFGGGWIFLIPVYMFKRASYLKQKNYYAWVWILVFILTIFFY